MGYLDSRRRGINVWVDTASKIAQIFAIALAGVWTYYVFFRTNAPSLESKLNVRSEIYWSNASDDKTCIGVFHAWVKNDGLSSFDIEDINLRAWLVGTDFMAGSLADSSPILLDFHHVESSDVPFYQGEPEPIKSDVAAHYSPGSQNDSEIAFLFKKSPGQTVLFRLALAGRGSKSLFFPIGKEVYNYTWARDKVCGDQSGTAEGKRLPGGSSPGNR